MESLLTEVAKSSPFAAVLAVFMFFGFRFLAKVIENGNAACAEREQRMAARINLLEDQRREDGKEREQVQHEIMRACADALATNAATFKKFTDQGSGTHTTIGGHR